MDSAATRAPVQREEQQQAEKEAQTCAEKVALIAGVTGIVGGSLAELLLLAKNGDPKWKVYGTSRRALPAWLQRHPVHHIQCDLLDRQQALTSLSRLTDVTHVFYVTWTSRSTEEDNCIANTTMLQNTLEPLLSNCKNLQHICLQTGIKHYIGSHLAFSPSTAPVYLESAPRHPDINFYYAQEDHLLDLLSLPRPLGFYTPVSWSIHRPGLIFGLSSLSLVNAALALGMYASICKHEHTPFVFPGTEMTWNSHLNTSDSLLVAKQEIWASTHAHAHNQAFNVSNGGDITWKGLWQVMATHFELKPVQFLENPPRLVSLMQGKMHVWEDMVKQYDLCHTKIANFLKGWEILDVVLHEMRAGKSSMIKSKAFGFHDTIDTTDSLIYWLERMKYEKLIP